MLSYIKKGVFLVLPPPQLYFETGKQKVLFTKLEVVQCQWQGTSCYLYFLILESEYILFLVPIAGR